MSYYQEGWEAYAIGKFEWQNPYPRFSLSGKQWSDGFNDCQEACSDTCNYGSLPINSENPV